MTTTAAKYRIDDLARLSGSTVRNVRSYQEKGLLPPPIREGRAAFYGEEHLARLRTITAMLERGFSLQNISELLDGWKEGKDIVDLLGLEAALTSPFTDEEPVDVDLTEILALFTDLETLPGVFSRALHVGLIEPSDVPGKFRVPSMRLLRAGAELHAAGVPIPALFEEVERLRGEIDQVAKRFVSVVLTHVIQPRLTETPNFPEIEELVRRVRPLAKRIVDAELSRALEFHVRSALGKHAGLIAPPRATSRKKRA